MLLFTQAIISHITHLHCKSHTKIVWGGSNDISKNNTNEALHQLCEFIEEITLVKLVIMKAPLRHDLRPTSCVNNEVQKVNRLIEKRVKPYRNVKIFNLDLDRSYCTTHGQHLNTSGKESIVNRLTIMIKNMSGMKQSIPIQLPWKESINDTNQSQMTSNKTTLNTETSKLPTLIQTGIETTKSSDPKNLTSTTLLDPPKHQRKQVALRNTDYLWI